jgi:hypothetical protein
MADEGATAGAGTNGAASPGAKPGRAGKRKAAFKLPPPAAPVKGLLLNASLEEQTKAHATATAILATWLGQKTRGAVARELGIPVVRLKQLSEAALSGMVAGLLKQPSRMPKGGLPPEEDPVKLRKRIGQQEREIATLTELVALLKDLPANKALAREPRDEYPAQKKKLPPAPPRRAGAPERMAAHAGGAAAGRPGTAGEGAGGE